MTRHFEKTVRRLELKAQLARCGLSYRELARILGERGIAVRECDITRIVAGRWSPAPDIKEEIAAILGRPTFELFQ